MDIIDKFNSLPEELQQLLKDTFNKGGWGDCYETFIVYDKEVELDAYGACTNDAKLAGHFSGRKVSQLFRKLYKLMECNKSGNGKWITHKSDWWGDGTGDMLFIKFSDYDKVMEWIKN